MKAIVNVNKNSHYAKYNGLTFEVDQVLTKQVALKIPSTELNKNVITNFGFSEVIIVDIQNELQKAFNNYNWGYSNLYHNLKEYCNINNILVTKPEYNCPA